MTAEIGFFAAMFLCLSLISPASPCGSEYGPGVCHASTYPTAGATQITQP